MPDKQRTELTPAEEENFGKWYKEFAVKKNMNLDPDSSEHNADFRRIWLRRSGQEESAGGQPDSKMDRIASNLKKVTKKQIVSDEELEKRVSKRSRS